MCYSENLDEVYNEVFVQGELNEAYYLEKNIAFINLMAIRYLSFHSVPNNYLMPPFFYRDNESTDNQCMYCHMHSCKYMNVNPVWSVHILH